MNDQRMVPLAFLERIGYQLSDTDDMVELKAIIDGPGVEPVALPDGLHEETKRLVVQFASAMAEKLYAAELKYDYSDGWSYGDWMDECRAKLLEHLAKGDPRDVANYCAFLWYHKEPTAAPSAPVQAVPDEFCEWKPMDDEFMPGTYEGSCGAAWTFTDGGPKENTMNFCPECGRKVAAPQPPEHAPQRPLSDDGGESTAQSSAVACPTDKEK